MIMFFVVVFVVAFYCTKDIKLNVSGLRLPAISFFIILANVKLYIDHSLGYLLTIV